MAKKNAREDPTKPPVAENVQMSDIVFILDKMELLLKAVSEIGQDGKIKTVPADREHRNSFLKIDGRTYYKASEVQEFLNRKGKVLPAKIRKELGTQS